MQEKKCKACGEVKPVEYFYRNKNTSDGYLNKCKKCKTKGSSKWREAPVQRKREMMEEQKAKAKKWAQTHSVDDWDDQMIYLLLCYLRIPEETLKNKRFKTDSLNKIMRELCSYTRSKKQQNLYDANERQDVLEKSIEDYLFRKEHEEFLEQERRKNEATTK